jgi:hypothetical protein
MLGGALAFELVGESTYSKANAEADPSKQLSLWHGANTDRYVAEAFAVTGVAAAGVATWLYLRARRDDRVVVAPAVSSNEMGIFIVGGF